MEIDAMVMVSVDDHVVEPPNLFEGRLPAKYEDLAPKFITNEDGTDAWLYEGQMPQRRPQRRGRTAARGVRHRADLLRPAPSGLLRHRRAGQGHGRQRRARLPVLPVVPAVLRAALRPDRGQGRGPGHGPGLQRLAHRRVVRDPPGPLHPAAPIPAIWDPEVLAAEVRRTAAKGCHAVTFSENPSSSGCRASTPTTGTRSGRRAATRPVVVACTSARRRELLSPRPTPRSTCSSP